VHAPAGDGHVVVGSDDGKIRLFSSSTLTMAKTSIPGLGAPITAVDVAYDSKWVLATTNKYLMVVKTQFRDKHGRCVDRQLVQGCIDHVAALYLG
jgi:VID27 C-terminal WD40-like domain